MKHTKEPWEKSGLNGVYGSKSQQIAVMGDGEYEEVQANVRRIVACVNACEGMTTEAIERGVIKELLKALKWARKNLILSSRTGNASWDIIEQAIAKAEGEK